MNEPKGIPCSPCTVAQQLSRLGGWSKMSHFSTVLQGLLLIAFLLCSPSPSPSPGSLAGREVGEARAEPWPAVVVFEQTPQSQCSGIPVSTLCLLDEGSKVLTAPLKMFSLFIKPRKSNNLDIGSSVIGTEVFVIKLKVLSFTFLVISP